jgi:hypothetical protein
MFTTEREDTMSTHQSRGSRITREHQAGIDPAVPARDPTRSASRGEGRRRRAAVGVAALLAAVTLVGPPAAHAGTYTIADCPSAAGHTTVTGPWQVFGQSPQTILKTECGGEPAALFFADSELPPTPIGFEASTSGTELSIVDARIWWRAFGSPSGAVEAETEVSDSSGNPLSIGQADGSGELFAQTTTPEEFRFPASDHASTIKLAEHCFEGDTCPMTESFGVGIEIFGAELTLEDEAPPVVSISSVQNEGPSFLGPVAVSFTASDPEAGVQKAELLLDGAPVATRNYGGSCSYTRLQPCQGTVSDRFGGISLPEGGYELAVRVTDAAGNTTVAPVPHVANGVPCAGPTIALTADHAPNGATIPFGQGATIEGRLACGPTPIPGATVMLGTAALPGVPLVSGPLITGPQGEFSFQVPPGPNRELVFSYRAWSNEASATTAAIQVNVQPRMRLQICVDQRPPHHVHRRRAHAGRSRCSHQTHNHGTITWTGSVEGGPYPVGGMPVLVQVKEGSHWQTFESLQISNGRFSYHYTFLRTRHPTTYTFRLALPAGGDVGYPYVASASGPVSVRVR